MGLYRVTGENSLDVVCAAIDLGYRHFDTAASYRNEALVGDAIRKSGLPRDDFFITTKVPVADHGYDETLASFERSLDELRTDWVDLYLIHWPAPAVNRYVDTWRALISLAETKAVRAIGVCNFEPEQLERIVGETSVVPAVNQVELHPAFQQARLRRLHGRLGVVTVAWSPLARGVALASPALASIATRLGVSVSQVVLRWHLQLGNVVIPKSSHPGRLAENRNITGFELTSDDMAQITRLDTGQRQGPDPATHLG